LAFEKVLSIFVGDPFTNDLSIRVTREEIFDTTADDEVKE